MSTVINIESDQEENDDIEQNEVEEVDEQNVENGNNSAGGGEEDEEPVPKKPQTKRKRRRSSRGPWICFSVVLVLIVIGVPTGVYFGAFHNPNDGKNTTVTPGGGTSAIPDGGGTDTDPSGGGTDTNPSGGLKNLLYQILLLHLPILPRHATRTSPTDI